MLTPNLWLIPLLCLQIWVLITSNSVLAREMQCGTPKDVPDTSYVYKGIRLPNGRYKNGTVVTYTCDPGHTMGKDSLGVVTCTGGMWKDVDKVRCCKIHICTDPDLFCKLPYVKSTTTDITKGEESFELPDGTMAYGVGTTIEFKCQADYNLQNGSRTGSFECQRGGKWSPDSFTKCNLKECPPPPTVPNAKYVRLDGDLRDSKFHIGSRVKYNCDSGYELSAGSLSSTLTCTSQFQWRISMGYITLDHLHAMLNIPKCTKPHRPWAYTERPYQPTYDGGGSSSSGSGTQYTYSKKKTEWSAWKSVVAFFASGIAICICCAAICSHLKEKDRQRARSQARTVAGVTTTEYVDPSVRHFGPPPTLTTLPYTYVPPSAPPEMYPLAPPRISLQPSPREQPNSAARLISHNYEGPPPNYDDAVKADTAAPSAPNFV